MENSFYQWLRQERMWIEGDMDSRSVTHVFLDGGKVHVEDDDMERFHEVYCDCVAKNIPQYVVEQRTPVFKLFMDVDLQSKTIIDDETILRICETIAAAAREFFDPMESDVIVCTAPVRELPGVIRSYKHGIHLHWKDIYVVSSKALTFRNLCIKRCAESFGDTCFHNTWVKIIDAAVYKSSGLRLIGSLKRGISGTYLPQYVLRPDRMVIKVESPMTNLLTWVKECSIRLPIGLPSFSGAAYNTDSTDDRHEEAILGSSHKGHLTRVSLRDFKDTLACFMKVVATFPFFKTFRVTSVYKIDSSNGANPAYIIGTSCKRCMNKASGIHNSNHIYFFVDKKGIHQRCFCRCETLEGRKYKMCKDFSHKLCDLPNDLMTRLYPGTQRVATMNNNSVAAQCKTIIDRISK